VAILNKKHIQYAIKILFIIYVLISFVPFSSIITARGPPIEWWKANWTYRKSVFINSSFISNNLFNFPLLVDVTDSSFAANSHGGDIVFTDAENNKLYHELVSYNNTNGRLIAWVKVPEIHSRKDTKLYIYYGNSEIYRQEDIENVWDANYVMVLHLDEEQGFAFDSTGNGNDGITHKIRRGVQGVIDDAYDFYYNYETGYLEVVHNEGIIGFDNFTVSFWMKLDDKVHGQALLGKFDTSSDQRSWFIGYKLSSIFKPIISLYASADGHKTVDWNAALLTSVYDWIYVTVVWESGSIPKFYINGALVVTSGSSTISTIYQNIAPLHIGKSPLPEYLDLDGYLDEIRLSSSARSPDWILTEYNNLHDPTGFISWGEEETQPDSPVIFNPSPIDLVIVSIELTELNFGLMDYQGDLMNFTVSTNPDIGKASFDDVGNGNYSIPVSGLEYYETYEWKVEVTDGVNTVSKVFSFTPVRPGDDIIPPKADAGMDMIVDEDQSFQFDGSNSKDNIGVSDYSWTFMDERSRMLTGVNPTYTFSMPGIYQVLLVVTDFAGNQDTDFFLVTVRDVTNPDAQIQIVEETVFVGNPITFDGGSSTDNVNVTLFKWNLGDGTSVDGKKLVHRYTEIGVYNVTLTVQDAKGNIDIDWIEVTVSPSWGSDLYLLIIFIVFILAVIYSVYHVYVSSSKPRREIFRIE